ncbi:MAG: 50S ribosomal protein L7Ae/L30e/S12e/Gadd45 [Peptococcaceae bacterium BRH_c4a]|nr:MAG: 50S ribosomal protein L7Ae/L30e/S12e/Gadd45 [Peptococcaceae bacterium BRH_c4a]
MSLERLSKARKKTIGTKQTLKAINHNQARVVYVAKNADRNVTEPIIQACLVRSVPVVTVESMQVLGKACGIEVGCASTAIVEE